MEEIKMISVLIHRIDFLVIGYNATLILSILIV